MVLTAATLRYQKWARRSSETQSRHFRHLDWEKSSDINTTLES
jgi:hypothetical protein